MLNPLIHTNIEQQKNETEQTNETKQKNETEQTHNNKSNDTYWDCTWCIFCNLDCLFMCCSE